MLAAQIALVVLSAPLIASAWYLGALGLGSLLDRREPPAGSTRRRFAIVIPAHDEAIALPQLIDSLSALDYPRDRWRVLVVADNCSDDTARVAHDRGVDVIERTDPDRRGKGYALAFGLEHLTGRDHDAVVFIDADCVVRPNLLRAFDARLGAGADAVQAYYTMRSRDESAEARLREVALALVHEVRPQGKRWFGGSAGIKGSGMCVSRRGLEAAPWRAHGLAEDIEQHAALLRAGVRVAFAPEATVTGDAPSSLRNASGQHRRWEAGRLAAARRYAAPLALRGVRRRDLAALDAAIELAIPPLSVLVFGFALAAGAAALIGPGWFRWLELSAGVSLDTYIGAGFVALHLGPREALRTLLSAPAFVAWKLVLYARALVARPASWEPTRRERTAPP